MSGLRGKNTVQCVFNLRVKNHKPISTLFDHFQIVFTIIPRPHRPCFNKKVVSTSINVVKGVHDLCAKIICI